MKITFKKQFQKDLKKATSTSLLPKIKQLIQIVSQNPFQTPPPYEKLVGEDDVYSRRINQQHRLIYTIQDQEISFLRCFGHYE